MLDVGKEERDYYEETKWRRKGEEGNEGHQLFDGRFLAAWSAGVPRFPARAFVRTTRRVSGAGKGVGVGSTTAWEWVGMVGSVRTTRRVCGERKGMEVVSMTASKWVGVGSIMARE